MKLLAFGLILICSYAWAIEIDDNFFENSGELASISSKLKDAINGPLRDSIKNGDSGLEIPPLDPFNADQLSVKIDAKPLQTAIEAQLSNVKLNGLSTYKVNDASFKIFGLKLHIDLTWSTLTGKTNYTIQQTGTVLGNEVYGSGGIDGSARDFRFIIDVKFKLKGKYIRITSLSTKITLGSLDFHATGLYNDEAKSKAVSEAVSRDAPKIINETKQKDLTNYVSGEIMTECNKILSTMTLKELLKKIGM